MVKLKRLKIEKYRNLKPGTELHFRDSLNVLLGRNGTGKTTLLNLIVQLLSWDFSALLGEPFSLEYDILTDEAHLRVSLRNELRTKPERVVLDAEEGEQGISTASLMQTSARYQASGEIVVTLVESGEKYRLVVSGSRLTLGLGDEAGPSWGMDYEAPILGQTSMADLLVVLSDLEETEELGVPDLHSLSSALVSSVAGFLRNLKRFDESLGYLDFITRSSSTFVVNKMQGGEYWATSRGGAPKILRSHLNERLQSEPDADEVRIQSSDEGAWFLSRVVELLEFKHAHVGLQRLAMKTQPRLRIEFGNMRFDFTRRDGEIFNHTLLSYGQKRLVAFYYYLACNSSCVVADELVNGMHHGWIGPCLEDIGERQAFLTSQNPLLLDYLFFESAEEVRSSFVLCRMESHDNREQMVWENMALDEAESFFSAYQVAIHHVGELLRLRGLW